MLCDLNEIPTTFYGGWQADTKLHLEKQTRIDRKTEKFLKTKKRKKGRKKLQGGLGIQDMKHTIKPL